MILRKWRGVALFGAVFAALVLAACGSSQKGSSAAAPAAGAPVSNASLSISNTQVSATALPAVSAPTQASATLTFLSGDVQENTGGSWQEAQIGDELHAGSQIRVGDNSYCEVQFGDEAIARLQANTEIAISTLVLAKDRQVDVNLTQGAIINKVQKLASGDSYNVTTPTTVCGVRGTEFSVASSSTAQTAVAVKEGVVVVVPPDATAQSLAPGATGAAADAAQAVAAGIAASAPQVTAGQQIVVTNVDFQQTKTQLAQIQAAIKQGSSSQDIDAMTQTAASATSASAPKPVAISQSAAQALTVTDAMSLIPTAPAATQSTAAAAPAVVQVAVTVSPANAQIQLDGSAVGTKSFTGMFAVGKLITLTASLDGYQTQVVPLTVPQNGVALTITLPQNATNPPAQNPQPSASQPAAPQPAPAKPAAQSAPASNPAQTAAVVQRGTVSIQTSPSNAQITINGSFAGTGSASRQFDAGTQVSYRASARGYADAQGSVTVSANGTQSETLTLIPKPIEGSYTISSSAFVRDAVVWNDALIVVDKNGTLWSVSPQGAVNWHVATNNASNENARPFLDGGTVYFSGSHDFLAVDASTGRTLFTKSLGQNDADIFGRTVSAGNGEIFFSTDSQITVYASGTSNVLRTLQIPGTSNMSAAYASGYLYIVDQQGTLYKLDAKSGATVGSVSSTAIQPVAMTPAVRGTQVFFVGRRGTAVLADPGAGKILWQKPLEAGISTGVFTDPVFTASGIYVVAKNTLYAMAPSDGHNLFAPIQNVSAPPLVDGDTLYYGTTDGTLVKASAASGATLGTVKLPSAASARPATLGDDVAVATSSGGVVLVYPGTMR